MERLVQHLYPLELSYDKETNQKTMEFNVEATEFRPRRDVVVAVKIRNQLLVDD